MVFGALCAVNSSLHSYLIVSYAKEDGVSLDMGVLHVERSEATDWYGSLRLGLSGVWVGRVLLDIECIRADRGTDFYQAPEAFRGCLTLLFTSNS